MAAAVVAWPLTAAAYLQLLHGVGLLIVRFHESFVLCDQQLVLP